MICRIDQFTSHRDKQSGDPTPKGSTRMAADHVNNASKFKGHADGVHEWQAIGDDAATHTA